MNVARLGLWLVSLLGGSGLLVGAASATSCAVGVEWNGLRYQGAGFESATRFAGRLSDGVVPPCADEAGCQADEGTTVAVFRLRGVDPAVAIGSRGESARREVYLAPGYFPELPGHPLHAAAYGSDRRPDERAGWHCGPAIENLAGRVVDHPPGWGYVFAVRFEGDRVRRQHGFTTLFVDAQTTITGFDRHGLPYIEQGDQLVATAHECTASGERYKVVADSIVRPA